MRRFRQLDNYEVMEAACDVKSWDYPRVIELDELDHGHWYRWSPDCIFWLCCTDTEERVFELHVAVAPQVRGLMFPRRWALGVEIIGELLGARYLEARDCPGLDTVATYMPRLGWEPVEGGSSWRRELPDGRL